MSKKLLVEAVADRAGVNKKAVLTVLEALAAVTEQTLVQGFDVVLPGIGKLQSKATAARTARNPQTGEKVPVPASKKVKFTATSALKAAVAA